MKLNLFKTVFLFLCLSVATTGTARIKVACVGNSITYGMTIPDRETNSYPARLAKMLGDEYDVGNFGKNGATLLAKGHRPYIGQEEFQKAKDFVPDIVVIHLGVNDTDPRDYPEYGDFFVQDYVALIDSFRCVNPDVRVIIANLSPILSRHPRFKSGTRQWRDSIRNLIPAVARVTGAELIDFGKVLRDHPNVIPDGIHPNEKGAAMLAETVFGAITGDFGGLRMPEIYGDGMVLQRYKPLRISGTANAGDTVTVTVGRNSSRALADNLGQWTVQLPPMKEGMGFSMTVSDGKTSYIYNNVSVGEVWLASGQSNMAFTLAEASTFQEDLPLMADSLLRFFDMKWIAATDSKEWSEEHKDRVDSLGYYLPARWTASSPESARRFSAVAWYFGKTLRDSLNVPVGIISNAIGGSPAEAWIDIETLEHGIPEILVDWRTNDYLQPWVKKRAVENASSQAGRRHPYEPSYLFSAGIRPLAAYPIAGTIWYQGESNAHNVEVHETLFPMLVTSWREYWHEPSMPFLFVQLSSINRPSWPSFRDSQRRMALQIPNVAMAVSSDYGNPTDVHPKDKRPVGRRLARQALNRVYGMTDVVPEGPRIVRAIPDGPGTVILTFDYADRLKTSDNLPLRTFEIAETEGIYYPADSAEILNNNTIRITCMATEKPNFVRYGWQPYTTANLVNGEGLPTSTFKIPVDEQQPDDYGISSGVSAAYVGIANGKIIQAGGCNFPENPMAPDSKKKYYDGIYLIEREPDGNICTKRTGSLPFAMAYGAAVTSPEGLVLIGGTTPEESLSAVFLLKVDDEGKPELTSLPSLPFSADNLAGTYYEGKIYIAGGNVDGSPSRIFYSLDMNDIAKGWTGLTALPGNPRVQPVMAASDGKIFLWGGFAPKGTDRPASLETDGLSYNLKTKKWSKADAPADADGEKISTGGGAASALPDGRIAVTGGVNKDIFLEALHNQAPDYLSHPAEWYRFNDLLLIFNPKTEKWTTESRDPSLARAGAGIAVTQDGEMYLIGGEIKPRIRTAEILKLKP